jgi:hypothetical protein
MSGMSALEEYSCEAMALALGPSADVGQPASMLALAEPAARTTTRSAALLLPVHMSVVALLPTL